MDCRKYPNFTEAEFQCKHTGQCHMDPDFMERLQALREAYGKPMKVNSGYRHPTHPIEARKANPGAHTYGRAVDIAVRGSDAYNLLALAMDFGFTGIGVHQKGNTRFLHLDDISGVKGFPRPSIWSY